STPMSIVMLWTKSCRILTLAVTCLASRLAQMTLPQQGPRSEAKPRLGTGIGCPCQKCVEVDRFRAGSLQRVLDADAPRLRRINPASKGGQTIGCGQRIIIDDVINARLGRQRGDGCGDRVIDVNERRAVSLSSERFARPLIFPRKQIGDGDSPC